MFLAIAGVLAPDEIAAARGMLAEARFRDGRETAGRVAAKVKANMQADPADPRTRDVRRLIAAALTRNGAFNAAARPARLSALLLSRCRPGDGYGAHMDDAIMKGTEDGGGPMRADVAFTVFLSDPDAYKGGALVIEATDGERAYRLPAGSALVYPANTLHRVDPVTDGERLVAAGWAQSFVRAADQREILYDLERAAAEAEAAGAENAARRLRKTMSNLLRMWAEV
jgi:PKHD-type hydroxylase